MIKWRLVGMKLMVSSISLTEKDKCKLVAGFIRMIVGIRIVPENTIMFMQMVHDNLLDGSGMKVLGIIFSLMVREDRMN